MTIYDFGHAEKMLYLAMEFLEGWSLEEQLDAADHLPWRRSLEIVADIAESLEEAHDKGIIHRDLKPGNVLLETDGVTCVAKLTDFGTA